MAWSGTNGLASVPRPFPLLPSPLCNSLLYANPLELREMTCHEEQASVQTRPGKGAGDASGQRRRPGLLCPRRLHKDALDATAFISSLASGGEFVFLGGVSPGLLPPRLGGRPARRAPVRTGIAYLHGAPGVLRRTAAALLRGSAASRVFQWILSQSTYSLYSQRSSASILPDATRVHVPVQCSYTYARESDERVR